MESLFGKKEKPFSGRPLSLGTPSFPAFSLLPEDFRIGKGAGAEFRGSVFRPKPQDFARGVLLLRHVKTAKMAVYRRFLAGKAPHYGWRGVFPLGANIALDTVFSISELKGKHDENRRKYQ